MNWPLWAAIAPLPDEVSMETQTNVISQRSESSFLWQEDDVCRIKESRNAIAPSLTPSMRRYLLFRP